MEITYLGHSSFRLRTLDACVVTDPYSKEVGFSFPKTSADVVTISHDHFDHNNLAGVVGTSRREKPFVIDTPGEYEIGGISVFGVDTFHDNDNGTKRGLNTVYSILLDSVSVVHLGDLGHKLSDDQIAEINGADVLLCPIGGIYTIGVKEAIEVINQIEPSIVIPMHYKTESHNMDKFNELSSLDEFVKGLGIEQKAMDKLTISKMSLPEEMELVILAPKVK